MPDLGVIPASMAVSAVPLLVPPLVPLLTLRLARLMVGGASEYSGGTEPRAYPMDHANRCYLPVEHSLLIPSIVRSFRAEFEARCGRGRQSCRAAVLPKVLDFDEARGDFVYARARKPVVPAG